MGMTITVAGRSLPAGNVTSISVNNELIWSSNTGRSAESGKMLGDIVAMKKTVSLEFQWLKKADYDSLISAVNTSPFMPVKIMLDNSTLIDFTAYRSTVEGTLGGSYGGVWYYQSAKLELIQQ